MFRGIRLAALTAALVPLLLTGCSAPAPAVTSSPTPTATSTPAFASKEEAFAAAEKVYKRYLRVVARSAAHPDKVRISDFDGVTTESAAQAEYQSLGRAAKSGIHGSGPLRLAVFSGQKYDETARTLSAYVCVDYSDSRILTSSGRDVTPDDRPVTRTSVATFTLGAQVLFASKTAFEGKALC